MTDYQDEPDTITTTAAASRRGMIVNPFNAQSAAPRPCGSGLPTAVRASTFRLPGRRSRRLLLLHTQLGVWPTHSVATYVAYGGGAGLAG